MKYKFGFIGCGNMGSVLLLSLLKNCSAENVALCDNSKEKTDCLKKEYSLAVLSAREIAEQCEYVFLGVKPQVLPTLLYEIKDSLKENVLISMAAATEIKKIEEIVGKDIPVIRIMPNTSVAVEEGIILYCYNKFVNAENLSVFKNALSSSGIIDEIEEEKIDAGMALTSCGPAFVDMFIEALAQGGEECQIEKEKALLYACQTVIGAAKTVVVTKKSPKELKEAVCSPGGTTIEGVKVLEDRQFQDAVKEAVIAAFNKTKKLK